MDIVRAVDITWGRFVPPGLFVIGVDKGSCHLRFSGIRPLRGSPPPLNGKSV